VAEGETAVLDKISNSYNLARESFSILRKDKELMVFPVLAGVASIVVLAGFVIPLLALVGVSGAEKIMEDNDPVVWGWKVLYLFGVYVGTSFVTIFCNAGLVGAVMMRLDGKDPTVGDGLRIAFSRIGLIFQWSLVAATVGMILRALEGDRKNFSLGRIIAGILGAAWTVVTYLVVPVLVVEGLGPWAALKRSGSLLRQTWGEQIMGNLGLGAFFGVVGMLGTVLIGALGYLVGLMPVAVAVLVVFWVLLAVLSQTLTAIYRASVYYFATGKPLPPELDRDLIVSAFVPVRES
jgi:hypothetical protein